MTKEYIGQTDRGTIVVKDDETGKLHLIDEKWPVDMTAEEARRRLYIAKAKLAEIQLEELVRGFPGTAI